MFPLRDENPTELVPFITFLLILTNAAVWLFVQGAGSGEMFLESLCQYGAIPGEVTGSIPAGSTIDLGPGATCRVGGLGAWSLLTSMFMHGGWMHLLGNMLYLWIFGNNIEDSMGHLRFILFYLICGVAAVLAQALPNTGSEIPMVGASGAISGILGAYLLLHPHARVLVVIPIGFIIQAIQLRAVWVLGLWFGMQLLSSTLTASDEGGIAFGAHIGGFIAGIALIPVFKHRGIALQNPFGPDPHR